MGNGWILVCDLEDKSIQGLVPASYLDIAINDPLNPITLSWLREITNAAHQKTAIESIEDVVIDQVFQNLKDKTSGTNYNLKLIINLFMLVKHIMICMNCIANWYLNFLVNFQNYLPSVKN